MIDLDPQTASKSPYMMAAMNGLVGLVGALVALRGVPGLTWVERLSNVASGTAMTVFLGPAASQYFGLETLETKMAMAFAIGLFGLNLMAAVLQWIKTLNIGDYIPWKRGGQ